MFEALVFTYLGLLMAYVIFAKRMSSESLYKKDFVYVIGMPVTTCLAKTHQKRFINKTEALRLSQLYGPKNIEEGSQHYISRKVGLVLIVLSVGLFMALIIGHDYQEETDLNAMIQRPAYGENSITLNVAYQVEDDGETIKRTMPLIVDAQVPTGNQAQEILEEQMALITGAMLGDAQTQNHVFQDLMFEEAPFEVPIKATYRSLTPDYLTDKGELRRNRMSLNEGVEASVLVTLVLSDRMLQDIYDFVLYREPISLTQEIAMISERIVVEDEQVILPTSLLEQDIPLTWYKAVVGVRGGQVFVVAMILSLLIYIHQKDDLTKELEKRQRMILMDFPDVVSKLTMLINAGMSFSRAWQKIVVDYQERGNGKRPLYEEMLVATSYIQNGMPEKEALELFGRRTNSKEVMRMTAILIQNLRRGNHSLTVALKQLSIEAWDIRTTSAKMLGEKASTKLLLPMGISFVTVIIIVLAPTLMSMNL